MKKQQNFLGLLRAKPGDFNRRAFIETFACFRFTHIAGFREIINSALLVEGGFIDRGYALSAIKGALGPAAKQLRPVLSRTMPDRKWSDCHGDQVAWAHAGQALRFDKACIVVKALEIALKRESSSALEAIDVHKFVTLHPAIYVLRHLENWRKLIDMPQRLTDGERALLTRLKAALTPSEDYGEGPGDVGRIDVFVKETVSGAPVTWRSAEVFCRILNEAGPSKGGSQGSSLLVREVTAERLLSRNDGGNRVRNKTCNQHEGPYVGLSSELMDQLTRLCPPREFGDG
jgi:hypothetical protein